MTEGLQIPLEVCERIVDFCAYDCHSASDYKLLPACALTSRRWLPRSRWHLYYTVHILHEESFRGYLATIQVLPKLAGYMRLLTLGRWRNSKGEADEALYKPDDTWICQVPTRILPFTPNLCLIYLYALPPFNATTEKYLSLFRHHRNVTSLAVNAPLISCRDLTRLLSFFPSVDRVNLSGVNILLESTVPTSVYPRPFPSLTYLNCAALSGRALQTCRFWPLSKTLLRLQYSCWTAAMGAGLQNILSQCERLETFYVRFGDAGYPGM